MASSLTGPSLLHRVLGLALAASFMVSGTGLGVSVVPCAARRRGLGWPASGRGAAPPTPGGVSKTGAF
jgi:hypothetical protein